MLKKKASCLAADIKRHGRKAEAEMMPLTENSTCGSTWSEQGTEETTASTCAVLLGAKRQSRRETELEQQRHRRSRRSPSASSAAPVLDDCPQSVPSVRGASPKPRRQQWSTMWFVQLSVVVVGLAVAATIALVFTLRDAEEKDRNGSPRLEDDGSDAAGDDKITFEPGGIQLHNADVKDQGPRATRNTDDASVEGRVRPASGSSSAGSVGGRGPSMSERGTTTSGSPAPAGVIWLDDGTFGQVRPEGLPLSPRDGTSELDGGRRWNSVSPDDNIASAVAKSTDDTSSSFLGKNANKRVFAKNGRALKRLNRKAVSRKQGVIGLLYN